MVLVVSVVILGLIQSMNCWAHPSAYEHDDELEAVLFEPGFSEYKSNKIKENVKALEYASYITVDQFHGNGKEQFEYLKKLDINGLPFSFSSIDYYEDLSGKTKEDGSKVQISANNHRKYTHQGWERQYENKNVNKFMEKRRNVLMATVNYVFDFRTVTFIRGYDDKCKSLSGIIYYTHILGDYAEADDYKKISFLIPLAEGKDKDKEYMIPNIKKYIEVLFANQLSDADYKALVKELDSIEKKASKIESSTGGVNTDEEFELIHEYASDVLETLIKYIPGLLKDEEFFKKVFYPEVA